MDRLTRQINGKVSTISKLRPRPSRKRPAKSEKHGETIDLPAIRNTLNRFSPPPLPKEDDPVVGVSPPARQKNNQQIDEIINGALMTYRNHKINRVIFASPLTGRNSMGRSYYRSSRFDTVDCAPGRYQSPRLSSKPPPDFNSLTIRIDKQHSLYGNEMLKLATTRDQRYNSQDSPLGMLNTVPNQVKYHQARFKRSSKRKDDQKTPSREIDDMCSPWVQQEEDYAL